MVQGSKFKVLSSLRDGRVGWWMGARNHDELVVWQRAVDLAVASYELTRPFPSSELYGLTSQIRRASVSVASNIAEGFYRPPIDFQRFLSMALGSIAELRTQLEIARRVGLISNDDCSSLGKRFSSLSNQVRALRQSIVSSPRSGARTSNLELRTHASYP